MSRPVTMSQVVRAFGTGRGLHEEVFDDTMVTQWNDGITVEFEDPPQRLTVRFELGEAGEEEPVPPDESHYRYHTPAGPNPACASCRYLHWSQPGPS